jgi:hypothetical protein
MARTAAAPGDVSGSLSIGRAVSATRAATASAATSATGIPWYLWCGVLAVTSSAVGGAWDVSWHRSIGRDTFWTPAHMAIYACGVLAALACGYLILAASFGNSQPLKAASVHVLGLRAPLGAFLAAWGGVAMLTSAPFDNWWHAAYGLDVKIVSPPHTLLILGIRAVSAGVLFLLLAEMNRAADAAPASFQHLQRLFLYIAGLVLAGQMFFLMEYTWDVQLHSAQAYIVMAIALPLVLAALARASRHPWAATWMAAVYMLFAIGEILILPLFPAQPKLGPVFHQITHMVPAKFPILLIAPALALDLLWQRSRSGKTWVVALLSGAVFVTVLVAVEWPFADFLMSKWSANRFFGSIYFDYNSRPNGFDRERLFFMPSHGWSLGAGLAEAAFYAFIGSWIGLRLGRWMQNLQR